MSTNELEQNIVQHALARAKRSMWGVFGFSFIENVLLLTSPLFMLQVYDRVLLSRSGSTLAGLLAVAIFLLAILLVMEVVRNLLLNRISVRFDQDIAELTFTEVLSTGAVSKPIHDVNSIRSFLNAPYILALFDIPFLPMYLGLIYFLHPMLGHIGVLGAGVLFLLAIVNDRLTRVPAQRSNEAFGSANKFVEHSARNKDAVLGMGMLPRLTTLWRNYQSAGMGFHILSSDRNALISGIAKVFRQVIQVSVLATGGYLVIQDITSPGVMIAASIIIGRALAPVEQSIQGWRGLNKVRESYRSLREFMQAYRQPNPTIPLPVPLGNIKLANVVALSDSDPLKAETPIPIIKSVSCSIAQGEFVGITGPSGSGKSTLARLILGIIRPISGTVRIDGAELTAEVQRQFSPYFGYLPQDVELFDGTVAENIAKFRDDEALKVIDAAQLAGAHSVILSLPEGYETRIGPSGANLSGGQKQRIGLARALFDSPALVVLDEPTSNLDNSGRLAFLNTIKQLKSTGCTVILIGHQPSLFSSMDKMAFVVSGQIQKYGPASEVIEEFTPRKVPTGGKAVVGVNPSADSKSDKQVVRPKRSAVVTQVRRN